MDLRERRSLLSSKTNPDMNLDYVCSIGSRLDSAIADTPLQFRVRYVPDRVILSPDSLDSYLASVCRLQWESLEECAATALNDMNDVLIPRWIEVSLSVDDNGHYHDVVLDDRQPEWQDKGLLSRLSNT